MKTWKEFEKKLTEWYSYLGPAATRMSRALRGEKVEDIAWWKFSIEAKTRKKIPGYLHKWMKQAVANSGGKTPVIHWHQDREKIGEDYVILKAEAFRYFMSLLHDMLDREGG